MATGTDVSLQDHVDRALYRIYTLRDMGYDPYLMIYNKPDAPAILTKMQRWCNNKFIFKKTPRFEDYDVNLKYSRLKPQEGGNRK